jgi:hypothetical protein
MKTTQNDRSTFFNFDFLLGQKVISKSVDYDKNMIFWNNLWSEGPTLILKVVQNLILNIYAVSNF